MQYNKKDDGSLEPLKQMNIDTGLGLERMARILQKVLHSFEFLYKSPFLILLVFLRNFNYNSGISAPVFLAPYFTPLLAC